MVAPACQIISCPCPCPPRPSLTIDEQSIKDAHKKLNTIHACIRRSNDYDRFDILSQMIKELFGAAFVCVELIDKKEIIYRSHSEIESDAFTVIAIPKSKYPFTPLLSEKEKVVVIEDLYTNAITNYTKHCIKLNNDEQDIRFYAGAPIVTSDNIRIGTLCIMDKHPRMFSYQNRMFLVNMAGIISMEIEKNYLLSKRHNYNTRVLRILDYYDEVHILCSYNATTNKWTILYTNPLFLYIANLSSSNVLQRQLSDFFTFNGYDPSHNYDFSINPVVFLTEMVNLLSPDKQIVKAKFQPCFLPLDINSAKHPDFRFSETDGNSQVNYFISYRVPGTHVPEITNTLLGVPIRTDCICHSQTPVTIQKLIGPLLTPHVSHKNLLHAYDYSSRIHEGVAFDENVCWDTMVTHEDYEYTMYYAISNGKFTTSTGALDYQKAIQCFLQITRAVSYIIKKNIPFTPEQISSSQLFWKEPDRIWKLSHIGLLDFKTTPTNSPSPSPSPKKQNLKDKIAAAIQRIALIMWQVVHSTNSIEIVVQPYPDGVTHDIMNLIYRILHKYNDSCNTYSSLSDLEEELLRLDWLA